MEQQTGWLDKADKRFFLSLATITVFAIVTNLAYMVMHENLHAAICRAHSGEARTDYSLVYMGKAMTYCAGILPPTLVYLNSWVEIVGYHFQAAMNLFMGWKICELLIQTINGD